MISLKETLRTILNILNQRTPLIGDIEINVSGTNPSTKYPGTTWTEVGSGRCLMGAGTWDETTHLAGTTVDSKLPNIKGVGHYADNNNAFSGALYNAGSAAYIGDGSASGTLIGLDASLYNDIYNDSCTIVQPPSLIVHFWERTA